MQTEGDRLRYFIDSKGLNIRQFCLKNHIVYTSLHPIVEGSRPLGMNILKQITSAYPDLNVNWILFGRGNMELNADENYILKDIEARYEKIDPGYEAFLKYLEKDKTIKKLQDLIDHVISQKENGKN